MRKTGVNAEPYNHLLGMKTIRILAAGIVFLSGLTVLLGMIELRVFPITRRDDTLPFLYRFGLASAGNVSLALAESPKGKLMGKLRSLRVCLKDHKITIEDLRAGPYSGNRSNGPRFGSHGEFIFPVDQIDHAYVAMEIGVDRESSRVEIYCVPVTLLSRDAFNWTEQPSQTREATATDGKAAAGQPPRQP